MRAMAAIRAERVVAILQRVLDTAHLVEAMLADDRVDVVQAAG
jgi:hypothetical protein